MDEEDKEINEWNAKEKERRRERIKKWRDEYKKRPEVKAAGREYYYRHKKDPRVIKNKKIRSRALSRAQWKLIKNHRDEYNQYVKEFMAIEYNLIEKEIDEQDKDSKARTE
jgi:hypothetical protein